MKLRLAALILVLIAAASPTESNAQWQKSQDQLLDLKWDPQSGGVLEYHDGMVWAASKDVYTSTDHGSTWRMMPRFIADGDWVTCLRFWGDTAYLGTIDGYLWRSTDNGQTWTTILQEWAIGGLTFAGSSRDLLVLFAAPGFVWRSSDAGSTWKPDSLDQFAQDIIYARGVALATLVDQVDGHLWNSTDKGITWHEGTGAFNFDSFSLSVDSCTNNVYVVNEEERNVLDGICKILVSTDVGETWTPTFQHDREYLGGTIVSSSAALFTTTLIEGVLRSTDQGQNWGSIGGPNIREDTHFLLPISDNELIAVDQDGSVWTTTNSGGSPLTVPANVFSLSRADLFNGRTVAACSFDMDSLELTRVVGSCTGPLTIVHQQIVGPDSQYYSILDSAFRAAVPLDTIAVFLAPDSSRDYHATLVLTLWNGETRRITLNGHGTTAPHVILSATNISTGTIGGIETIAIKSDRPIEHSCDLRVRFDPTPLEYKGIEPGFSGVTEVARSVGEIVLHVSGSNTLSADSTIAALQFRFLPVDGPTTTITIDSLTYAPDSACGDYVATTATITSTADACSRQILARYVKTGETPVFTISPNPASRSISLVSDRARDVTITLYNALGELLSKQYAHVGREASLLDVSTLPEGMISVSIEADGVTRAYHVLVIHR